MKTNIFCVRLVPLLVGIILISVQVVAFSANSSRESPEKRRIKSIPDELDKFVQFFKPYVQEVVEEKAPASVGDCATGIHHPPQPCEQIGPLLVLKTNWYKTIGRWIAGLNQARLTTLSFDVLQPNVLGFYAAIELPKLSMSMRAEGCVFGMCKTLFDDADSCCGTNKHFMALISVDCSPTEPYLTNLNVEYTNIFPSIKLRPGGKFNFADLTIMTEKIIMEQMLGIVPDDILDQLNRYIPQIIGRYEYTCASLKGSELQEQTDDHDDDVETFRTQLLENLSGLR